MFEGEEDEDEDHEDHESEDEESDVVVNVAESEEVHCIVNSQTKPAIL